MPKTIRDNADIDKTFAPLFDSMLLTLLADTSLKILTFFTIFFFQTSLLRARCRKKDEVEEGKILHSFERCLSDSTVEKWPSV